MPVQEKSPRGRQSIFSKVLINYLAMALVIVLLVGALGVLLIRQYLTSNNLDDLQERAQAVALSLGKSDGRLRVLTPSGLREIESMCDAKIVYVGSDMVARQMPVKGYKNGAAAKSNASPDVTPSPSSSPPSGKTAFGARSAEDRASPGYPVLRARMDALYSQLFPLPGDADENSAQALGRYNLAGSVDEELVRSIMNGEMATDVRQLEFVSYPVMFAGAPIIDYESGEVAAAIILCRPLTEVGEVTTSILQILLLAGLTALLCATVLAWLLSRRLTRPLSELSRIASQMADGQYNAQFPVTRHDEIGMLGDTLNTLSSRLSDTIGTLAGEKNKLEQILASIGEGIIAIDQSGRVIHANAAALNLLELRAWDVHPDNPHSLDQQRVLIDMLNRSMVDDERVVTRWETVQNRAIEAIASPVKGVGEQTLGAVCLVRDVSESEKLEQMRRDYIANISHELRTPLTGIRGMVEPLLDGMLDTDEEKNNSYLIIYQETIRLEKMIGEMLDISRLQSGKAQVELEPMEPHGLLEAVKRRMQSRADEGEVALLISADDPPLMLMGNEDRIVQVLIILVDNALSFTPPGGSVTLFARKRPDGRVALGVRDTGSGIDPVDLPYIWERFYKADRSRMRTCGTGLGLAIAKLVVELMHGEISVDTEPGKGSTFTFTLPGTNPPTRG